MIKTVVDTITIELENGDRVKLDAGTIVGSLLDSSLSDSDLPCIAAMVNNDACSLSYPLTVNSKVRFLTMADSHGWRIYRRSLCFLLGKAVKDLFPDAVFSVEHSFGLGLYCSFHPSASTDKGITARQLRELDERMRELVESNIPIERHKVSFSDAVAQFEQAGQHDKLKLLKYRNPPRVVVHTCERFSDLAHGPLVPSTGVLKLFELIHYEPGFVLHLPDRSKPSRLPPFQDQPHLFRIFQEHKDWGRILGVNTVGRLNEIIANNEIDDFVRTAEALHEKKVARIADEIAAGRDRIRLILVAGPSSAGKTTFSKRLATHLRVNGLKSATLSSDNYFVGMEHNPVDENGEPDFEHIEAVDLKLFNNHLLQLIEGREIEVPYYNFSAKQREYHGTRLRIDSGQMIIIEGIHGLNPRLTEDVPPEVEFRIFVSALTQLSVDSNNRISTTDNRLMRRIVRDHKFRGHSALFTLQLWSKVRNGEKTWIYPFQREAHATFNSALDYELAVLKPFVEPLLMQVKPDNREYAEARRLSEFLLNFLSTSDRPVPGTSILREYIGGSMFDY